MTEQEQIKEMAKEICPIAQAKILPCERCAFEKSCTAYVNATALYNAGYRKIDEIQLECENASLTVENEVLWTTDETKFKEIAQSYVDRLIEVQNYIIERKKRELENIKQSIIKAGLEVKE